MNTNPRCPRCNGNTWASSRWCPRCGDYDDNAPQAPVVPATLQNTCPVCGESIPGNRGALARHTRSHAIYGAQCEMRLE